MQLDDKAVFQAELPASGDVGAAFASKVKGFEQGFLSKFEDIYTTLGETVLQGLRRRRAGGHSDLWPPGEGSSAREECAV